MAASNMWPRLTMPARIAWSNGARPCRPNSTNGRKPCRFAKPAFTFKEWCGTRCNTNGSTTTTDNFVPRWERALFIHRPALRLHRRTRPFGYNARPAKKNNRKDYCDETSFAYSHGVAPHIGWPNRGRCSKWVSFSGNEDHTLRQTRAGTDHGTSSGRTWRRASRDNATARGFPARGDAGRREAAG